MSENETVQVNVAGEKVIAVKAEETERTVGGIRYIYGVHEMCISNVQWKTMITNLRNKKEGFNADIALMTHMKKLSYTDLILPKTGEFRKAYVNIYKMLKHYLFEKARLPDQTMIIDFFNSPKAKEEVLNE